MTLSWVNTPISHDLMSMFSDYDGDADGKDGGSELGPLAFVTRGHEVFETAIGDNEVNETMLLQTIVPNALVSEDETFDKNLLAVSSKYGFVILGVQGGLLILRHVDLKSFFLTHMSESTDFGDNWFIPLGNREVKLLAIDAEESTLAVCYEPQQNQSMIDIFNVADLRSPIKNFKIPYQVKAMQWCPAQKSHYLMVLSKPQHGKIEVFCTSKPVPEVYRRWDRYYAAAWSPDGLRLAALQKGTPDGNKMNILNLQGSTVEKSLDFQRGPDSNLYKFWNEYSLDKIHEDLSSVVWCSEEVALVVCFEDWKNGSNGQIKPWEYCNKVWINGESSPKELSDYNLAPPEEGKSFRLYTVKFDISDGEKLAQSILAPENNEATDEPGMKGSCFLASSTDNMVLNFDLGSNIIAGDEEPLFAMLNSGDDDGQHAGIGVLRVPTDLSCHDIKLDKATTDPNDYKACLLLHISNTGRLFAHSLCPNSNPAHGKFWLLRDDQGDLKEVEPRFHPSRDKEALPVIEAQEKKLNAERQREEKERKDREEEQKKEDERQRVLKEKQLKAQRERQEQIERETKEALMREERKKEEARKAKQKQDQEKIRLKLEEDAKAQAQAAKDRQQEQERQRQMTISKNNEGIKKVQQQLMPLSGSDNLSKSLSTSLEEIQKNLELLRLSEQDSKFVQEQDKVWDSFDLVETYQEETQKCLVKSKGALDAVGSFLEYVKIVEDEEKGNNRWVRYSDMDYEQMKQLESLEGDMRDIDAMCRILLSTSLSKRSRLFGTMVINKSPMGKQHQGRLTSDIARPKDPTKALEAYCTDIKDKLRKLEGDAKMVADSLHIEIRSCEYTEQERSRRVNPYREARKRLKKLRDSFRNTANDKAVDVRMDEKQKKKKEEEERLKRGRPKAPIIKIEDEEKQRTLVAPPMASSVVPKREDGFMAPATESRPAQAAEQVQQPKTASKDATVPPLFNNNFSTGTSFSFGSVSAGQTAAPFASTIGGAKDASTQQEAKKPAGLFGAPSSTAAPFGLSITTTGSDASPFAAFSATKSGSTPAFGEVSGGNKRAPLPTTSSPMPSFTTNFLGAATTGIGATSFGAKPTAVTPAPAPFTSTVFVQGKEPQAPLKQAAPAPSPAPAKQVEAKPVASSGGAALPPMSSLKKQFTKEMPGGGGPKASAPAPTPAPAPAPAPAPSNLGVTAAPPMSSLTKQFTKDMPGGGGGKAPAPAPSALGGAALPPMSSLKKSFTKEMPGVGAKAPAPAPTTTAQAPAPSLATTKKPTEPLTAPPKTDATPAAPITSTVPATAKATDAKPVATSFSFGSTSAQPASTGLVRTESQAFMGTAKPPADFKPLGGGTTVGLGSWGTDTQKAATTSGASAFTFQDTTAALSKFSFGADTTTKTQPTLSTPAKPSASPFLGGSTGISTPATQASQPIFGTPSTPTTPAPAPATSLFGQQNKSTPLTTTSFGGATTTPTSSLFGQPAPITPTTTAFGQQQTPAPGFGQSTAFGSTLTHAPPQASPGAGLFGGEAAMLKAKMAELYDVVGEPKKKDGIDKALDKYAGKYQELCARLLALYEPRMNEPLKASFRAMAGSPQVPAMPGANVMPQQNMSPFGQRMGAANQGMGGMAQQPSYGFGNTGGLAQNAPSKGGFGTGGGFGGFASNPMQALTQNAPQMGSAQLGGGGGFGGFSNSNPMQQFAQQAAQPGFQAQGFGGGATPGGFGTNTASAFGGAQQPSMFGGGQQANQSLFGNNSGAGGFGNAGFANAFAPRS